MVFIQKYILFKQSITLLSTLIIIEACANENLLIWRNNRYIWVQLLLHNNGGLFGGARFLY